MGFNFREETFTQLCHVSSGLFDLLWQLFMATSLIFFLTWVSRDFFTFLSKFTTFYKNCTTFTRTFLTFPVVRIFSIRFGKFLLKLMIFRSFPTFRNIPKIFSTSTYFIQENSVSKTFSILATTKPSLVFSLDRMKSEVDITAFIFFFLTRSREWHENYYCENSALFSFERFFLSVSVIVTGDAVWLELKQQTEETQSSKRWKRNTTVESNAKRVIVNERVSRCVCERGNQKEGNVRWRKDIGGSEMTSTSYFLSFNFSVSGLTKEKQRITNTSRSREPTNPWSVTAKLSPARVCVCAVVCQAVKSRIPEKKKNIERERIKCL